jgi:thiopeptide-type bacteriocin biosynthesis protein
LADRRVSKLMLDTYDREIERYGGDRGIVLCEHIFRADSDATLAIVQSASGDAGQDARWRLALRGMHLFLVELGFDLATRHRIMVPIRDGFAREHRADADLERQLGARFRMERASLDPLIRDDEAAFADTPLAEGVAALGMRTEAIAPHAAELRALHAAGKLDDPLDHVVGALLHMHANRVLRSEQRAQELVLYDMLARLYESDLARAKAAAKKAQSA